MIAFIDVPSKKALSICNPPVSTACQVALVFLVGGLRDHLRARRWTLAVQITKANSTKDTGQRDGLSEVG